ncbi:Putative succinyl-CoA transferase Rv0802c [Corynebacterium kutscheri]|uniref:Acetyltransferase, ribosomal protein N-acetylase n=1 Tax=Corynebacterium kutscheri TaxID=35755 RepID=A0A0F6TCZ2_9CORY|nr:GNAT family N-acetyltransferase [Corynebacterium kutscheri]AKE41279.1 acetyltransferase, ribosomal protein N-acetylase [Corynebacterium kutscheri]VEH08555.1 Putative succinyl-CoA transferase Rv0802c [Corynebacterium kutscheri]VEH09601.1 Putative succinyl-CoA transferase Rv0802c [Corynebacterium kutscheri]VEH79684.1 Putative succinyl-CoA transferase Rv0802c [Corynebacterium kutscheri]
MHIEEFFPPYGIQISAAELTMRPIRESDLEKLISTLEKPIYNDPNVDYAFPWYKLDRLSRARSVFEYQSKWKTESTAHDWRIPFLVLIQDEIIGSQEIQAKDFLNTKTIISGSYLFLAQQGKGYGKLMRQMILALAFDYFGAEYAYSEAAIANGASRGVSRALGYTETIGETVAMRLAKKDFIRPTIPLQIKGAENALFGAW